MAGCVFCDRIAVGHVAFSGDQAVAFPDAFALNPGHTLVVPRSHEADLFALPRDVRAGVWALVDVVVEDLRWKHDPDGFNIGLNSSEAAGQTVPHAHVHVIPRFRGDVEDPRGGVRWVIPQRAAYWKRD